MLTLRNAGNRFDMLFKVGESLNPFFDLNEPPCKHHSSILYTHIPPTTTPKKGIRSSKNCRPENANELSTQCLRYAHRFPKKGTSEISQAT